MRRPLLAALTAALTLLPTAALAHPSFNPNEVGAGTPTQATLVVPHGCAPDGGMPEDGGASLATIELALQLPDGVLVEPGVVDGWDTSVEDGADDYPAVRLTVVGAGGGQDPSDGGSQATDEPTEPTEGHAIEPTDLAIAKDDGLGTDAASEHAYGPTSTGDPLPAGVQALAGEPTDATATVAMVVIVALLVLLLASGLAAIRRDRP